MTVETLPISDAIVKGYGTMMPERVFQELLKIGFTTIKSDTSLIDDLFHKLDEDTRDDMKAFFAAHVVDVRLNFPVDSILFPMVTIVNQSDNEDVSSDVLGDFMGQEFDEGGSYTTEILGHALNSSYQVYCLAGKDSNAALWMYYLTKAVLMLNVQTLYVHGLHNIVYSGQDIRVREDLFPEKTYARLLTVQCFNWFSVRATQRVVSKLTVAAFTENAETGEKIQLNVEAP